MNLNCQCVRFLVALIVASTLAFKFTVLHTSDFHSHMEGIGPDYYKSLVKGHAARLATLVKKFQQTNKGHTLTLDGGDWFAGSMFHVLTSSYMFPKLPPVELALFDYLKYDATTLGNHEFDLTEDGLARVIAKANATGLRVPIVLSNALFNQQNTCTSPLAKLVDTKQNIEFEAPRYAQESNNFAPIKSYILKELKDETTGETLRVGIIGLLGPHATKMSLPERKCVHFHGFDDTTTKEQFQQYIDFVHDFTIKLRQTHKLNIVIAVTHSGHDDDTRLMAALYKKSAGDESLKTIDVHLSSHTHDMELNVYRDTSRAQDVKQIDLQVHGENHKIEIAPLHSIIHQSGPFGIALGVLQLEYNFTTRQLYLLNENVPQRDYFYVDGYTREQLVPVRVLVTPHIPYDEHVYQLVGKYKSMLNKEFLAATPFKYDSIVTHKFLTNFTSNVEMARWLCDIMYDQFCKFIAATRSSNNHEYEINQEGKVENTQVKCDLDVYMTAVDAIRIHDLKEYNKINDSIVFQFSDAYRIFGIGSMLPYQNSHSIHYVSDPVSHFYLKKSMLLTLIQALKIVNYFDPMTSMAFSHSLSWKNRWYGIPFYNWIYDVRVNGVPIEDIKSKHIHIALPYYVAKFFSKAKELSFGLAELNIFDKRGKSLKRMELAKSTVYEYLMFAEHMHSKIKH